MKTLSEPSALEIKEKKIYSQWGLTDEEYRMIEEDILGRMPNYTCLLYTSDAADEEDSVDLGGRRIIKKKKKERETNSREHKKKKKRKKYQHND